MGYINNDNVNKTILIVDDEKDYLFFTSQVLKKFGYNVITADTGETAVEIALNERNINLILMDIVLETGIDGTEAARLILQKIDVPIVFLTAYPDQEIDEKVDDITRYGYVIKSSGDFVLKSNIELALKLFEANKKNEKNEKQFKGLFNHSPNGIALIEVIYNNRGEICDGIIIAVNPALEYATDLSAEIIIGRNFIDIYPEILKTDHLQKLDDMIKKGRAYFSEKYYEPSGKYFQFWIYEIDKGLVVLVMVDITDETIIRQSLAETELNLKSLKLLHQITDNIPAGIACVNAASLKYIFVNRTFAEKFGMATHKIIGVEVEDILGEDVYMRAWPYIHRALNGERVTYENMIPVNGVERCFKIDYIPQMDVNEEVQYLVILAIDITERKIKDEKILTLLAEKEILIKEVHHRIKNNMNTISGILFLQSDSMKDPSAVAALQDAQSRIHSMMVLYDKLYRSNSVGRMSLKEYIHPLIDEILYSFPDYQMVKTVKNIDDFVIHDSYLFPIGIIINELITNIMKYAFHGREEGCIDVSASVINGHATIEIRDNGNGIPEYISFENSKGFGLQLVSILTDQIKGRIRIERGNGTKFVLVFPI